MTARPCEGCGAAFTDHAKDCPTSPGGPPPMAAPKPVGPPAPGAQPPMMPTLTPGPSPLTGASAWLSAPAGCTSVACGPLHVPVPARQPKFDRRSLAEAIDYLLTDAMARGHIAGSWNSPMDEVVDDVIEAIMRNL